MATALSVNHVLSTGLLESVIFDDIFLRMARCAPAHITVYRSVRPLRGMDVYHYHRVNRERALAHPAVVTVHHDPDDPYPWLRLRSFLPRWREADAVICINGAHQKRLVEEGIHATTVIPHGIDRDVLPVPAHARCVSASGRIRLGIVSRRYKRGFKGEDRMRALFDQLSPDLFAFTIVGDGREEEAAHARAAGFDVIFHPRLPYGLFGALYEEIDLLLIVSHWEAGPACLPEALGVGVPVATTRVGMACDWIRDGENGFLLSGDPGQDSRTLTRLAKDRSALRRLNQNAFATAPEVPSWQTVMARHFELYENLVAERRPA